MVVVNLIAGFSILVGVLVGMAFAISAVVTLVLIGRHPRSERGSIVGRSVVKLVLVLALATSPFLAAEWAEEQNDWVDVDDNGILDPFVNGSYDWVNINGGDVLRSWGLLNACILGAGAIVLREKSTRTTTAPLPG